MGATERRAARLELRRRYQAATSGATFAEIADFIASHEGWKALQEGAA